MATKRSSKASIEELKVSDVVSIDEKAPEPKAKKEAVTSLGVFNESGTLVRVYTESEHGEGFENLVKEFVSHEKRKNFIVRPYTPPPPPTREEDDPNQVKVYGAGGDVERVFSEKMHGKEYKELAEQLVKKYPERYRLK